ncbi:preprotein translocase subunit TatA [Halarchaeum sp. P4]|uniref:preprotein translocase subunit TatA n=1 Tax=Halarchaeum sp. P4 TaxID=3421639 RepID=UPI003EB6EFDC
MHALREAAVPAFMGIPGGMELFVILLVAIVLFGIPVILLLGGGGYLLARESEKDDRIEELEREVEHLRDQVEESPGSDTEVAGEESAADAEVASRDERRE